MIKFFTNEKSATWDFALTMILFFVLFSVFETARQWLTVAPESGWDFNNFLYEHREASELDCASPHAACCPAVFYFFFTIIINKILHKRVD